MILLVTNSLRCTSSRSHLTKYENVSSFSYFHNLLCYTQNTNDVIFLFAASLLSRARQRSGCARVVVQTADWPPAGELLIAVGNKNLYSHNLATTGLHNETQHFMEKIFNLSNMNVLLKGILYIPTKHQTLVV